MELRFDYIWAIPLNLYIKKTFPKHEVQTVTMKFFQDFYWTKYKNEKAQQIANNPGLAVMRVKTQTNEENGLGRDSIPKASSSEMEFHSKTHPLPH